MIRRVRVDERSIGSASEVLAVCRICKTRRTLNYKELTGLAWGGARTIQDLRRALFCEPCSYPGEYSQDLRLHITWADRPDSKIRLAPAADKEAA